MAGLDFDIVVERSLEKFVLNAVRIYSEISGYLRHRVAVKLGKNVQSPRNGARTANSQLG
jgi:hypothetical protein